MGERTSRHEVQESPLLTGIPLETKEAILEAAEYRKAAAKDILVHCGDKATHLFVLGSGNARYYKVTSEGEELLLHWLVPGDAFGLATLLENPPGYMGSAQADVECDFYGWTHADMRRLAQVYPQLAENALRITLTYLSAYMERHARLLTTTAEERLASTLVDLARRAGSVQQSGIHVGVTNEQLGSLADVGLFTTSRVLRGWERKGAITKRRGKVQIQSPEKLLA